MRSRFGRLNATTSTLVTWGVLVCSACGDDAAPGGNGGTSGSATSSSRSSSIHTASSSRSVTVTSNASSSTASGAGRKDGDRCASDAECAGGLCLTEAMYGFPGGLCSENCEGSGSCSDAGSICDVTNCLRLCDSEGSCGMPATLVCHTTREHIGMLENPRTPGSDPNDPFNSMRFCAADCASDADCTAGRVCDRDPLRPRCVEPESCSNMQNDNITRYVSDCEDGTCSSDPGCIDAYEGECTGALVLALGRTTGDTSTGDANLVGNCAGDSGSPEILYRFTPPATGEYAIRLTSAADLGFYIREECTERASELGCRNLYPGGEPEEGFIALTMGTAYTLVVDGGWIPPREGPFTLDVNVRGCGDGVCEYFPGDAPDGQSECTSCASDCEAHPSCGSCLDDGDCHAPLESLTCPECAEFVDPLSCVDDGFCDQAVEGCVCADCVTADNCSK